MPNKSEKINGSGDNESDEEKKDAEEVAEKKSKLPGPRDTEAHFFPGDKRQLNRILHAGDSSPETAIDNLREARDAIFPKVRGKRKILTYPEHQKIIVDNYSGGFDLSEWGASHILFDARTMILSLLMAEPMIGPKSKGSKRNAFVFGVGSGRLMPAFLDAAERLGYDDFTFLDLIGENLKKTKDLIVKVMGSAWLKRINFVTGDVSDPKVLEKIKDRFDFIMATWFVASEIIDPSSPEAFRTHREEVFGEKKLKGLFRTSRGVLVLEDPDSTRYNSTYNLAHYYTHYLLGKELQEQKEEPILPGINQHLFLSYFGHIGKGAKYHLRCIQSVQAMEEERRRAGFPSNQVVTSGVIPHEAIAKYDDESILKIIGRYWNQKSKQERLECFRDHFRRKINEDAITHPEDSPLAKWHTTRIWRQQN
jgi:hypothetical protein